MSTVREIECAIEALPSQQWWQIRRWMDAHEPKTNEPGDARSEKFEAWLVGSIGLAKGRLTTDERMRETRGED